MLRLTVWFAMLVATAAPVACGGSDGGSSDARTELEGLIRSQLPGKAKRQSGQAVVVEKVQCTKAGGNKYDCLASVKGSDGAGNLVTEDVSIDGTCDEDSCIWKTAGGSAPVPGPSPPPTSTPGDGEGMHTVRARLENAGYSVSEQPPGSDPGDEGSLVVRVGDAEFSVIFFESETAAARTEGGLQQVAQEKPNQAAVKRKGSTVFVGTIEEPASLPKDKFAKFVSDAGG